MKLNQLTPAHLKAFRTRYHLSTKEVAAMIGVHPLTWGRWERSENRIPVHLFLTLKPVADELRTLEKIALGD